MSSCISTICGQAKLLFNMFYDSHIMYSCLVFVCDLTSLAHIGVTASMSPSRENLNYQAFPQILRKRG